MNLRRASAIMASGTLVSRILGFLSLVLLSYAAGAVGSGANAFAVANAIPNMIYGIIAGGTVNAVLIPQIVKFSRDYDGGQQYINKITTLSLVLFGFITVIMTLLAPFIVALNAGAGFSPDTFQLATSLAYWCIPQVFFYAMYSVLGEVLNARKLYGPFTWAPVLNNLVFISGLIVFIVLFGADPEGLRAASFWNDTAITTLGGAATLGIAAQAVVLFMFWRLSGLRFRLNFNWRGIELGNLGKIFSWTFGMVAITTLAGLVENNISTLAGNNEASVAVMQRAWLLFMLPHSLIAVSVVTPYFTRLSETVLHDDAMAYKRSLSEAIRVINLGLVGVASVLMVSAFALARIFTPQPKVIFSLGLTLIAYLFGLIAFSTLYVLQKAFYALSDTRTPFFLAAIHSVLIVIGSLLCALLPAEYIVVGLATVVSGATIIQCSLAFRALRIKIGDFYVYEIVMKLTRYIVSTLPAVLAGITLLKFGLMDFAMRGIGEAMLSTVILTMVMMPLYLLTLIFTNCREIRFYFRGEL